MQAALPPIFASYIYIYIYVSRRKALPPIFADHISAMSAKEVVAELRR